jgi:hypothetical protein
VIDAETLVDPDALRAIDELVDPDEPHAVTARLAVTSAHKSNERPSQPLSKAGRSGCIVWFT